MEPIVNQIGLSCLWRSGRSVGRTIYAVIGNNRDTDPLIGVMDTPELSHAAVAGHNYLRLMAIESERKDN